MINMPSFTLSSDDDIGLQQKNSDLISTYVAVKCETNAGDVAAAIFKQRPAHHECQGTNCAEKVDDNFQSAESTESLYMRKEKDEGSRMLMMEEDVVETKSSSWEDIVHINNTQISNGGLSAGTSSIGPAYHQHDIQPADHEDEEEACLTPRAKEHRIAPETLICPPPPCKKRRTTPHQLSLPDCAKVRKRLSYAMPPSSAASSSANSASSAEYMRLQRQYAAASQVVVNPPDLHTFPACIKALFFP